MKNKIDSTNFNQEMVFDVTKVPSLKSFYKMNQKQRNYCFDNNIHFTYYPLIGKACFIDKDHIEMFNAL